MDDLKRLEKKADAAQRAYEAARDSAVDDIISNVKKLGLIDELCERLGVAKGGFASGPAAMREIPSAAERSSELDGRSVKGIDLDSKRKIVQRVIDAPAAGRMKAILLVAHTTHHFPNGVVGRLKASLVKDWVTQVESATKPRGRASKTKADDEDEPAGTSLEATKLRMQRLKIIGNPVQLVPEEDRPSRRKTACPAYNHCLTFILRQKWSAWTCDDCTGPGEQGTRRQGASSRRTG